jgi:phosphoribosylformylglycinamidine synthase
VAAAIALVRDAVRAGTVSAAHDVSDGGLACALAEAAIAGGVGIEVDLDPLVELRGCSGESCLFGEGPGGFVLAGPRAGLEALGGAGVDLLVVGAAGGNRITISAAEATIDVLLADAARAWHSLGERLEAALAP